MSKQHEEPAHEVTIHVNNQPVVVEGPRLTGAAIKKAAVDQGVQIGLDFQLAQLRPNGERGIIGDDDVVTVNKNSRFIATAPDDNS